MFAGAVKASGIGCGKQSRSLCLFPVILVFFPFVTSQPAHSFCQDTFLFDKHLGHNRTPALFLEKHVTAQVHQAAAFRYEMLLDKRWHDSCAQVLPGRTGGLWLKESVKLVAPVNTRASRITRARNLNIIAARDFARIDGRILFWTPSFCSRHSPANAKIQAVAQPLPQTSPHCLLRIALTSRCPRSCTHFKRFGLASA